MSAGDRNVTCPLTLQCDRQEYRLRIANCQYKHPRPLDLVGIEKDMGQHVPDHTQHIRLRHRHKRTTP